MKEYDANLFKQALSAVPISVHKLGETQYFPIAHRSQELEPIPVLKVHQGLSCPECDSLQVPATLSGQKQMQKHLKTDHPTLSLVVSQSAECVIQQLAKGAKYFKVKSVEQPTFDTNDQKNFREMYSLEKDFAKIMSFSNLGLQSNPKDYFLKTLGIETFVSRNGGLEMLKDRLGLLIDSTPTNVDNLPGPTVTSSIDEYFVRAKAAIEETPIGLKVYDFQLFRSNPLDC